MKYRILLTALFIFVTACPDDTQNSATVNEESNNQRSGSQPEQSADNAVFAIAQVEPASGSSVRGVVRFAKGEGGLTVTGNLSGVTPPGKHGFHIHEYGDCSAKDASSAGGHLNPLGRSHGAPNTVDSHVGDLGNIDVNDAGEAEFRIFLKDSFYMDEQLGGWDAIIDKAVIVHDGPDDLRSQPSGNAGDRIGCGVIVKASDVGE